MNAHKLLASALILGLVTLAGCSTDHSEQTVSFQKDVLPILQANCAECHTVPDGEGYQKSGLAVSTYAELMQGTKMGPIIIPGQSINSNLNRLVEGRPGVDPSIQMPHGKVQLPDEQLAILRQWVDQGAKNN